MEPNPYSREGAAMLVGDYGEEATARTLEHMGFDVIRVGGSSYDLLINGRVTVEVKTALPTLGSNGNKERWQFMLHKRSRGKPLEEHLLILRCHTGVEQDCLAWFYVIAGDLNGVGGLAKIDITSRPDKYKGKWARHLHAWDTVHEIVARAEKENWPDLTDDALRNYPDRTKYAKG